MRETAIPTVETSEPFHGLLPPYGKAELPAPPAFTPRNVLRAIGPGLIGLGIAIGSGEWLLGPAIVARYGPQLLWITTVSVLLQVFLNIEMARYTLYTGEPVMIGFMRTRPGPRFWSGTYAVLTFFQVGWPGWALASATASAALVLGRMPDDADAGLVRALGYATFGASLLVLAFGRKTERNLELAMWVLLTAVFGYLLFVDVTMVSADSWRVTASGFVAFGTLPAGADWLLIGAFAAFSGLGGVGNAFMTNWMRDKGYGMGSTVGYIPCIGGAHVDLSPHGNVFDVNDRTRKRWRDWFRFVNVDQWLVFTVGSIAGMFMTTLMAVEFVTPGSAGSGWAIAGLQADAIAKRSGPVFWYLTLLTGFWVLFKTQLGNSEGLVRALTDMLWSGSPAVRRWRGGDVRAVYYGVMIVFIVWGCIALNLAQPLTLVIISANIAGVNLVLLSLHTLFLNRRMLPAELRAPLWRQGMLVACAVFFGSFAIATIVSRLAG